MSKAGAGNMGLAQKELAYLRFKAGQVFKPGSEYGGKFELDRHAMEAAANAREFGYLLGLKVGEPYPGYEKALEIINSYPNLGNKAGLKELFLLDEKNLPYVWKALTGVQFGMIPIGLNIFNTTQTNNQ